MLVVIHLMTESSSKKAKDDLESIVIHLFNKKEEKEEKSNNNILYNCYFNVPLYTTNKKVTEDKKEEIPNNLFVCNNVNMEIDTDYHVSSAREIFKTICPDDEFLPKPPEQDEIIYDDDNTD